MLFQQAILGVLGGFALVTILSAASLTSNTSLHSGAAILKSSKLTAFLPAVALVVYGIRSFATVNIEKRIFRIGNDLASELSSTISSLSYSSFSSWSPAHLGSLLVQKSWNFSSNILLPLSKFVSDTCFSLSIVFLSIVQFGSLFIYSLILILVPFFIASYLFSRSAKKQGQTLSDAQKQLFKSSSIIINDYVESSAYQFRGKTMQDFRDASASIYSITTNIRESKEYPRVITEICAYFPLISISTLTLLSSENQLEAQGIFVSLVLSLIAALKALPSVQNAAALRVQMLTFRFSIYELYELFKLTADSSESDLNVSQCNQENQRTLFIRGNSININVHAVYSNDNQQILLHHYRSNFELGAKIAIRGQSGSGKSTFLAALMGLYSSPEYRLNDFTFANSSPLLDNDKTLIENIMLFYTENSSQLFTMNISELLVTFSNYYNIEINTLLGFSPSFWVKSVNDLSVGERQRLSLLRALVGCKPIILLDEATSGLDNILESRIVDFLLSLEGVTIFWITHSTDYLHKFTNILYVDAGHVKEEHKENYG